MNDNDMNNNNNNMNNNMNIDMIVEIPLKSNVKYEFDKKQNKMRCDRIISTSMLYPGNYGYIPNTLSGDGDPLDVLLICDYKIYPGTIINVKIVGVLLTIDEKGEDEKIIAVPAEDVDFSYKNINNYIDLGEMVINKIHHFFKHYKDNENEKWVKLNGFKNAEYAFNIYKKSLTRFIL
tara:strand:- start:3308 stop:3841 length:534 start_codon:yes stop_codon:yes gene_type:complete